MELAETSFPYVSNNTHDVKVPHHPPTTAYGYVDADWVATLPTVVQHPVLLFFLVAHLLLTVQNSNPLCP